MVSGRRGALAHGALSLTFIFLALQSVWEQVAEKEAYKAQLEVRNDLLCWIRE